MKQVLQVLVVAVIFIAVSGVYAQSYLDVPPDPNFAKDYLNNIIYADTTENGERVPDRVYRLQVGGIYYFNNIIKIDGDLKIIAEGEGTPEFSKAIILTGRNDQGKQPARFAEVHGDVLFKNLYFSCISDNDKQVNELIREYKDGAVLEMDNCYVEWARLFGFCRVYSSNTSVYVRDSYIKNITSTGGPFGGKLMQFQHNPVNEIVVQNTTIINMQGPAISIRFNTVNLFKFDHNTVVNTLKWPFHHEYWVNGEVTNNIFFNTSAYGENRVDASNQDQEGLQFGIINMFPVPDSLLAQVGMSSQSERKMQVRNNVYFFDQDVKDYLASWWAADSVREEPWMNERTQSWFDDDEAFPYMDGEPPIVEDVQFVEYPTADSLIKKMDQWRTDGQKTTWWWVDDDGNKIANETDRPHDLSYSTSSTAYTAADGGFPLGDLNWFPEKKAEWEEWMTGVEFRPASAPADFELAQNYPNPFNPETTIEYRLQSSGRVNITVFNMLGQKVKTLVNRTQAAGRFDVQWDGTDEQGVQAPSGLYYYQLDMNGVKMTRKMILMK